MQESITHIVDENNVKYSLFRLQNGKGAINVNDIDTENLVHRIIYPSYEIAEKKYNELIELIVKL